MSEWTETWCREPEGWLMESPGCRIFMPKDKRQRQVIWDMRGGAWVERLPARAAEGVKLAPIARQAPGVVIEPPPDKDHGARWSWIRRGAKGYEYERPSNTKRPARQEIAAVRGQAGNRNASGS